MTRKLIVALAAAAALAACGRTPTDATVSQPRSGGISRDDGGTPPPPPPADTTHRGGGGTLGSGT